MLQPTFTSLLARATTPSSPPLLLLTIFLGANDACFLPAASGRHAADFIGDELVPLDRFEATIRLFVEEVLIADRLADVGTKVVLVGPPPISVPPQHGSQRAFQTYLSKRRYAARMMEVAGSYGETGRVVGVDVWRAMVEEVLGRGERVEEVEEERLPGCGRPGAKEFEWGADGYFVDGLHFGTKVSALLVI